MPPIARFTASWQPLRALEPFSLRCVLWQSFAFASAFAFVFAGAVAKNLKSNVKFEIRESPRFVWGEGSAFRFWRPLDLGFQQSHFKFEILFHAQ